MYVTPSIFIHAGLQPENNRFQCFVFWDTTVMYTLHPSLVPRRFLLLRCPREVWEGVFLGESLSVKSRLTVADSDKSFIAQAHLRLKNEGIGEVG